jgi:hypothetical protein
VEALKPLQDWRMNLTEREANGIIVLAIQPAVLETKVNVMLFFGKHRS